MPRKISLAFLMVFLILGIPLTVLRYNLNFEGFIKVPVHITPQPSGPDEKVTSFNPNLIVWFKTGITRNEAERLIESLGISKYKLSDPKTWKNAEYGGVVVIEVPSGSEDEYIQNFRSDDRVLDVQINLVYEP